jgi:hypothetical protein
MYAIALTLHSLVRWAVLAAAAAATVVAWRGWLAGRPWTPGARRAGVAVVAAADLQVLLGLALYLLLSPFTPAGLARPGEALADPAYRYFAIYHPVLGLGVAVLAHLGTAFARRERTDARRWRVAALCWAAALWIGLFAVPWPNMALGRPLWPL